MNPSAFSSRLQCPTGPSSMQTWARCGPISYQGRWGNRVQHDPLNRRVGMNLLDFAGMFFDGLGM
jgi:hypothetical protein